MTLMLTVREAGTNAFSLECEEHGVFAQVGGSGDKLDMVVRNLTGHIINMHFGIKAEEVRVRQKYQWED